MFRLLCAYVLFALISAMSAHADGRAERVALLLRHVDTPESHCQLDTVADALKRLRFQVETSRSGNQEAITRFGKSASGAKAAFVYACDDEKPQSLQAAMQASELNFLFLLETPPAPRDAPFANIMKPGRDNLAIIQVRVTTAENGEIFAETLASKLHRPYGPPNDILSRAIVSSYYRSRGTMLAELRGKISSGYILAAPPTEKILDAWSRVQHSKDRKVLEEFIAKFPKTLFADLARSRLEKLP